MMKKYLKQGMVGLLLAALTLSGLSQGLAITAWADSGAVSQNLKNETNGDLLKIAEDGAEATQTPDVQENSASQESTDGQENTDSQDNGEGQESTDSQGTEEGQKNTDGQSSLDDQNNGENQDSSDSQSGEDVDSSQGEDSSDIQVLPEDSDSGKTESNTSVTSVKLNHKKITLLVGESEKLKATINPSTAKNKKVSWKSSNKKVVTVSKSGKITAKSAGSAVITVTTADGKKKATCKVVVKKKVPSAPKLKNTQARCVGGSITLNWSPVKNAKGYHIYRKTANGWQKVSTLKGVNNVLYRNRNVRPGNSVTYKVTAYNGSGEGKASDEITLTSTLQTPEITGLTKKKITWNAVAYATSYVVYVWKSEKSGWSKLGETTATSYQLKDYNKNYYYTVRAMSGNLQSSCDTSFTGKYNVSYSKKYKNSDKILFEGDSITAGTYASQYYSWAERSAALLGMKCTNRAKDGSSIYSTVTAKSVLARSKKEGFKGYKVIVLAVGSNDYGKNREMGSIDSNKSNTFYGAYNQVLTMIKKQNPKARVILCTPIERRVLGKDYTLYGTSAANALGYTLEEYSQAIRNLAEKYGCDLFDTASMGLVSKSTMNASTYDNAHPLPSTHIRMADAFVRTMFNS